MDQYKAFRRRNDELNRQNEERRARSQQRSDTERRHRERLAAELERRPPRKPEKRYSFQLILLIILVGVGLNGIALVMGNPQIRATVMGWLHSIAG